MIFNTFLITVQSLVNIGGLLLLILYIYSIIGMIYFGEVKRNGNMIDYIGFENFTSAFITLFTVATIDSWFQTTSAFTFGKSAWNHCVENPSYEDYVQNGYQTVGCGGSASAYIFFISFFFMVGLVFLKLFIAIILEGYMKTQVQDTRAFNNDIREHFREVWADFDPDATTFIRLSELRTFLFALGQPLGFDPSFNGRRFLQDKFIASLDLPTYHDFTSYQFLDVLDALSFRLMVLDHINKLDEAIQQQQPDIPTNLDEQEIKAKIEKEVNQLIFQKQSENIVAFKELYEKEQKKKRNKEKTKDQAGLTSSHHMAIEAAVRRMRCFITVRRKAEDPNYVSIEIGKEKEEEEAKSALASSQVQQQTRGVLAIANTARRFLRNLGQKIGAKINAGGQDIPQSIKQQDPNMSQLQQLVD
ncbi:hypothetical protein FGO68_gene6076 [Halteria grandinella]|uniref:EF-hand domain-containing protein n=1 Tax=Halteria grandinella TaxID=5974 RepID=A0A8J8P644_HALGN|nr:hypothetical protein FGO68_gene6076 [Halteria grandinella]